MDIDGRSLGYGVAIGVGGCVVLLYVVTFCASLVWSRKWFR